MSKKRKNKNPENNFVVREIDYDKLAVAIVKAHDKIEEQKKRNDVEVLVQSSKDWQRVTGITSNNTAIKILQTLWFMVRFPFVSKKYFINDNATSALLVTITQSILSIFQLLFVITGVCSLLLMFNIPNIGHWQWRNLYFIAPLMLSWIFYGMIRMSKAEIENMKDKQMLMSLFSAITSFVAMILALVALFV